LPDFIRDGRFGAGKILAFYQGWSTEQEIPESFDWLTYESLHADPGMALVRALRLAEFEPTGAEIEESLEFAQFDRLQAKERSGYFRSDILIPADPTDPESYKLRKGWIGGYTDYLSPEDIAYVDDLESTLGNPFA